MGVESLWYLYSHIKTRSSVEVLLLLIVTTSLTPCSFDIPDFQKCSWLFGVVGCGLFLVASSKLCLWHIIQPHSLRGEVFDAWLVSLILPHRLLGLVEKRLPLIPALHIFKHTHVAFGGILVEVDDSLVFKSWCRMPIIFLVGYNLGDVCVKLHSDIVCYRDSAPSGDIFLGEIWGAYSVNIALIHHLFRQFLILYVYLQFLLILFLLSV